MSPRAGLDRGQVVRAATELVNAEGSEALTLSRLAEILHVRTPSLYNHIDNLADLQRELALLSVQQLGERMTAAVIGKSGAEALLALAEAYRGYIKASPGLYMTGLQVKRTAHGQDPALLAAEDRVVRVVMAVIAVYHLDGPDALHAIRGLRSVVHGFATLEVVGGFGLPLDCDESFRRLMTLFIGSLQLAGATTE